MMPHRFLDSGVTDIVLSVISYSMAGLLGWVQYTGGAAEEIVNSMPEWYLWTLVGVIVGSVAFMNVSKGIRNLRSKSKDKNK